MKHFFVLFIALLTGAGLAHADDDAYYLVGWLNNWSTTDKSYPLTLQADGQTWAITVPSAGNDGWFKVAPASAYNAEHFWDHLYCAPYDGCRELNGTMVFGNHGAWLLPNESGVQTYTISINPSTMQSKRVQGLYFAGELIDVDAATGGFNLQIAFSTGALAGLSAATVTAE